MELNGRTELFNGDEVIVGVDYTDQILVISPSWLNDESRTIENQLFLAKGGFGCSPTTTGRAVIGEFLADGEKVRLNRGDFLGVLKPELVEEYKLKGEVV